MKRIIATTLCLLAATTAVAGSKPCENQDVSNTLCAFWPIPWQQFQASCRCYRSILVDTLSIACSNFQASYSIYYDDALSDSPGSNIETWIRDLPASRLIFGWTEGWYVDDDNSGTTTDFYLTVGARDEAWEAHRSFGVEAWEMQKVYVSGGYGIALTLPGIVNRFYGNMNNNALAVIEHNSSMSMADAYLNSLGVEGSYQTYICYQGDAVQLSTICSNTRYMIESLGCFSWPNGESTVGGMFGFGGNLWWVQYAGNPENRMSCKESCFVMAAHFTHVGCCRQTGQVVWSAIGEDVGSRYLVLGYSAEDSDAPDTLAIVPGQGTDGYGVVRTYAQSVPLSYGAFRIAEIGNDEGRVMQSPLFDWNADDCTTLDERIAQPELSLEPEPLPPPSDVIFEILPDSSLIPVSVSEIGQGDWLEGPPPEDQCADIVVYGRTTTEVNRVKSQVGQYRTPNGQYQLRVRAFTGSSSPVDARNALYATWLANGAWNDWWEPGDRTYPVLNGPELIIVGDSDKVSLMTYADDDVGTCMANCRSVQDIADWDGNGSPNAPVHVIPSETSTELDRMCRGADRLNNLRDVDVQQRIELFVDDEYGGEEGPAMRQAMQDVANYFDIYRAPTLRAESDYTYSQSLALGPADINDGRSEVWLTGFETDHFWWTEFLNRWNYDDLTTKQVIMVHAPSCATAAYWKSEGYDPTLAEMLMANDPNKTVAAGVVGQLNPDWDFRHLSFLDLWSVRVRQAPRGKSYGLLLHEAILDIQEQFERYGRGVVLLGAYLLTPPRIPQDAEELVPSTSFELKTSVVGQKETLIRLALPEPADVNLNVYDIQGRLVSRIKNGNVEAGDQTFIWFWHDVEQRLAPSGMYFIRCDAKGATHSYQGSGKALVLR